jgi:hypothetical protein
MESHSDSHRESLMPARTTALSTLAALLALAAPAGAQTPETARLGGAEVRLTPQPFLTEEELAVLRTVMRDAQALSLFFPEATGHAALAVAPAEGFVREGAPVASASARAGLPDAATARAAALEGCEGARGEGPACVIVLEIAPAP